ncbi:MAG: hypothetical protein P4L64_02480 [Caulobacteraceae bacterium]|nr:hypothetical protein [Caulobacteraceae bacterium]
MKNYYRDAPKSYAFDLIGVIALLIVLAAGSAYFEHNSLGYGLNIIKEALRIAAMPAILIAAFRGKAIPRILSAPWVALIGGLAIRST